jgi:hypothetical protein
VVQQPAVGRELAVVEEAAALVGPALALVCSFGFVLCCVVLFCLGASFVVSFYLGMRESWRSMAAGLPRLGGAAFAPLPPLCATPKKTKDADGKKNKKTPTDDQERAGEKAKDKRLTATPRAPGPRPPCPGSSCTAPP